MVTRTGKKVLGVVLIVIGLLALLTPFTPGSWLAFIGFELLGVRLAAKGRLLLLMGAFLKKKRDPQVSGENSKDVKA